MPFSRVRCLPPLVVTLVTAHLPAADPLGSAPLPIPPQDQGLPYTRSGLSQARAALAGLVVFHARRRYAWVEGRRVRLDDVHWEDESVERVGVVHAPGWAFLSHHPHQSLLVV